jgi:hypothetical protein
MDFSKSVLIMVSGREQKIAPDARATLPTQTQFAAVTPSWRCLSSIGYYLSNICADRECRRAKRTVRQIQGYLEAEADRTLLSRLVGTIAAAITRLRRGTREVLIWFEFIEDPPRSN